MYFSEHDRAPTRSLAAAAASVYGFGEILKVWPLIISVALETASLGQGHIFRCIQSNLISSFGQKLLNYTVSHSE